MGDIANALHIPRAKLIKRLEEVRGEAEAARKEANEKEHKRRKVVLDAVSKLSTDQVANMLSHHTGLRGDDLVKFVDEKVEKNKFTTIEPEPTAVETTLDRTIRVLNLAEDSTIEVKPSDSIYSYL